MSFKLHILTTQTQWQDVLINKNWKWNVFVQEEKVVAVVSAMASHQTLLGFECPMQCYVWVELLLVLSFAPGGFSLGSAVFCSPLKTINIPIQSRTHKHLNRFLRVFTCFIGKQIFTVFYICLNSLFSSIFYLLNRTPFLSSPLLCCWHYNFWCTFLIQFYSVLIIYYKNNVILLKPRNVNNAFTTDCKPVIFIDITFCLGLFACTVFIPPHFFT